MTTQLHPKSRLPVLYISGPMSGMSNDNFPAFNEMARKLRMLGFPVLNPADFGNNPEITWADCLKRDIAILGHAEAVILLDGYERSKGAALELDVARGLKLVIVSPTEHMEFLADYFDEGELRDALREDEMRQAATIVRIHRESDDYESEEVRTRRRKGTYLRIMKQCGRAIRQSKAS
jgi:hypothetical protein